MEKYVADEKSIGTKLKRGKELEGRTPSLSWVTSRFRNRDDDAPAGARPETTFHEGFVDGAVEGRYGYHLLMINLLNAYDPRRSGENRIGTKSGVCVFIYNRMQLACFIHKSALCNEVLAPASSYISFISICFFVINGKNVQERVGTRCDAILHLIVSVKFNIKIFVHKCDHEKLENIS